MEQRTREALLLLREYCQVFGLKPTAKAEDINEWEAECGPIIACAFNGNDGKNAGGRLSSLVKKPAGLLVISNGPAAC